MSALNYPKLALPDCAEVLAFRAVETVLSTDPTLSRVTRYFNAWTGDAADVLPPTFALCPYLQIAPAPLASDWEAEGLHKVPMAISLLCVVAGSNRDQLMNYWAAIRRALWPQDPDRFAAVRQVVQDARITRPVLQAQAYGVKVDEAGARMLVAEGSLRLILHVDTP